MSDSRKEIIVVLGSGRSGTSLLMQILEGFGMTGSEHVISASDQNPAGPREDALIFNHQTELITSMGLNPYLPLPLDWLKRDLVGKTMPKLQSHILMNIDNSDTIWGFKDPRTAQLLPMWIKIFNKIKVVPFYILTVRNPSSVVSSLATNYENPVETSELFWLSKYCDALKYTGGNVFIVHYEDWFTDKAEKMAADLLKFTGLDQFYSGNIQATLSAIIRPQLNRSQHNKRLINNHWVEHLYDRLLNCKGYQFDSIHLMQAVQEVQKAMNEFMGWPLASHHLLQDKQKQISKITQQLEKMKRNQVDLERLKVLEEELKAQQKEKENLVEQLEKMKRNQVDLERLKVLEEELKAQQKEKENLVEQLETIKEDINPLIHENKGLQNQNFYLRDKLSQVNLERLKVLEEELKAQQKEKENLVEQLEKLKRNQVNLERLKALKKELKAQQKKNTSIIRQRVPLKQFNNCRKKAILMRTGYSYRLGRILINMVSRPGIETVKAPFLLFELLWDVFTGKGRKKRDLELQQVIGSKPPK